MSGPSNVQAWRLGSDLDRDPAVRASTRDVVAQAIAYQLATRYSGDSRILEITTKSSIRAMG
jgi:hypothetical protein